jgi:hypothetical protein
MSKRLKKLIWIVPAAIVGMAVFVAIGGEVVRLLWNWLAPALFGLRQITFWEAVGLLALCRILFGGSGARWRHSHSRRRMAERCGRMTPEEREKFRQGLHGRWGREAPPDSKPSD